MENSPLISVIIPCFNVEKYVKDAINSILNQTYRNIEVWLIDDASTDNTLEIISSYSDCRIRKVLFDKNTNKIGAVNEVLKKVTGDFICFQDADDISDIKRLEYQLEFFLNHNEIDICFTKYQFIGSVKRICQFISDKNHDDLVNEFINYKAKKIGEDATHCPTMMIKKKVYEKYPGYHNFFQNGIIGEDTYWISKILRSFKGGTINKVLYSYRITEYSVTMSVGNDLGKIVRHELLEEIIKYENIFHVSPLNSGNESILMNLERIATNKALLYWVNEYKKMKNTYEKSSSYRLGKFILRPFFLIKSLLSTKKKS